MRTDRDILTRKLQTLFADDADRDEAIRILSEYGLGPYDRETERVRLAILKLSGPDLNRLAHNTMRARQDYRDVLAWAEYPRQSKHWSVPAGEKKERLVKADRDEYEAWLAE